MYAKVTSAYEKQSRGMYVVASAYRVYIAEAMSVYTVKHKQSCHKLVCVMITIIGTNQSEASWFCSLFQILLAQMI